MTSTTFGRVAALTLVVGVLGLAGCNRPSGDTAMGSPSTGSTGSTGSTSSRPNSSMPDSAASTPMASASSPTARP